MESMILTPRLACMAALVPPNARLADIGTDHGKLPISLLLDGHIASAIGSDIRSGPLAHAERNAKEHNVSAIVAFGGGSAMDTAKAIACMLDVEGDIIAYCKGLIKPTRRSKLLFAIPTTCGTGSESTDIGVVLDQEENYK